ncbi:MAG: LysM peptidoglycan-binding domain-containing protein [Lachnospiraceae bacterium]|nr:LysM peptidoglycan-binding domain-containing protein [Lachnospiraceae bacterium]
MELPKNIVQIGEPDKLHKIFVEDYVVSYMKQLGRSQAGSPVGLALYGKRVEEAGINYYFLYGAAKIEGLEHRGAYLSQVEKEEIEDIGKKYFEEYQFLAWCAVTEEPVEGFFVKIRGKGVEIKGYACFYEENESMLNYMLLSGEKEAKGRKEKAEPAERVRGNWTASAYIKQAVKPQTANAQTTEKPTAKPEDTASKDDTSNIKKPGVWRPEYNKVALAAACLALLILAVSTLNDADKMEELQVAARQVIASMTEQKLPDEEVDHPIDSVTSGNVLQGSTSSLLEERENAGTNSASQNGTGISETGNPQDINAGNQDTDITGAAQPQTLPSPQPEASQPSPEPTPEDSNTTTASTVPVTYTVQRGDTLNSICRERYGSLDKVAEICELNQIKNADSIQIGQTILLP